MLAVAAALMTYPGWNLTWSDEFSDAGKPDPTKWGYEKGFVRNSELQWYQEENAFLHDGYLVIEGRRGRVPNPGYEPLSKDWRKNRMFAHYTSAALETRNLHQWTYGRFEIRARIDPQKGLWPAIWFLGYGPWPSNGEIDLMEFYQNTVLANTAWGVGGGSWDTTKTPLSKFIQRDKDWGRKFHTWRMDWDADWIRLYLDGELLNETDLRTTVNPDGKNPFHESHFIILNMAIGSTGGDPSGLSFPRRFEVDHVRVFQKG